MNEFLRILRRDPALAGMTPDLHVGLTGQSDLGVLQCKPLGDQNLMVNQIDTGHLLRHRVLDLDPGVDLDEIELVRILIQQEFHRSRVVVPDGPAQSHRRIADLPSQVRRQIEGWRHLHYLLMPPLKGAIPLMEMDEIALPVAQDLHLQMPGPGDESFQKDLFSSECGHRFTLRLLKLRFQIRLSSHDTHAAPAPAVGRLEDHRKTHGGSQAPGFVQVREGRVAAL